MNKNYLFPLQQPGGKFLENKKLFSLAYRQWLQAREPKNPDGHEPDWGNCVFGLPHHEEPLQRNALLRAGYVGLYERSDEVFVEVPADGSWLREPTLVMRVLYETDVSQLLASGLSAAEAEDFSRQTLAQLTAIVLAQV